MKKLMLTLLSVGAVLSGTTVAELENLGGIGGVESLRGVSELETTRPADDFKKFPREQVLESSYVYQPPLILITFRL